jgi:hypothetical protein
MRSHWRTAQVREGQASKVLARMVVLMNAPLLIYPDAVLIASSAVCFLQTSSSTTHYQTIHHVSRRVSREEDAQRRRRWYQERRLVAKRAQGQHPAPT